MDWKFKHVFHVIVIVTTLFEPTTMVFVFYFKNISKLKYFKKKF